MPDARSTVLRLALVLALASGTPLAAQVWNAVVSEGDPVAGVGAVTRIDNLAVDDDGGWIVEVDTDNADTDADGALLRDGALFLREGQPLAAPAGSTLDSFDTVNLDNRGDSGWNLFLDGTSGSSDDSGVFLGDVLLVQEGSAPSAPGLSPGTIWRGFFECKKNDSDQILVLGTVDDPAIASTVDQVLLRLDLSQAGALLSETLVAKEGDVLPGQVDPVSTFSTNPHAFAFNDAGVAMFVADLDGPTGTDGVLSLGGTVLAQEGDPSPVAGRNWSSLSSARVDLNNCGDTVFTGTLDGDTASNSVIVRNGAVLAQEGSGVPDIAPFTFTSFGSGPVRIGENGAVLWYGNWDDPDTDVDEGLFLDDRLIVQEGVTQIDGIAVDTLRGIQDGYTLSRYGEWILFEAVLADGTEGAFLGGGGPWKGLGRGLAGSGAVTGTGGVPCHTATGTLAGGTPLTMSLDGALPNAPATFVFSVVELNAPFKQGTLVPFPEFLVFGLVTDAGGSVDLAANFPTGVPSDVDVFSQWWVTDPGGPAGFAASNALAGTTP